MNELQKFITEKFLVSSEIFLKALKLSPNAQGYLSGAITEFVLRDHLLSNGYEVARIKEKWEGDKHPNHHGDFYIRKRGSSNWFVLESKGIKTNSEKWHKLYNLPNLIKFLNKHLELTPFHSAEAMNKYIATNLPLFDTEYKSTFYTLNELRKYSSIKTSEKSQIIERLRQLSPRDYEVTADKRTRYTETAIKVLETHLVSGGSAKSLRTQATPRVDEFHILSLDLFLRTGKHEFIFVNPNLLEPSSKDRSHLQQNYIVDILFKDLKDSPSPKNPWSLDIDEVYKTLENPINENDMQSDNRSIDEIAQEIAAEE